MSCDFSSLTDRRNTYSLKWDVTDNELPMWVADMDFKTAPEITEAIQKKVATGIYGYTIVPDAYYEAISNWWERRHQFKIEKEWIIFCTGVVPAISSIVRRITNIGDNVLIQAPVYNIFYNSIVNSGRHILSSDLRYDGTTYHIDFADLEQKLADPLTTLMILCNPHNPIGRIWDKETLEKIGHLCYKHHVVVLSDEIHCDLTEPGYAYTPFAFVSSECAENSITCVAPTKTFNIAGLQTASVVIPNKAIRHKVNRGLNTDEVAEPNAFAMEATIAAFTKGEPWLNELNHYVTLNKEILRTFINNELPQLKVVPSKATYLIWIDCSAITEDTTPLCHFLRQETGLYISDGAAYGDNGRSFVRVNIACPKVRLEDGLHRLKVGITKYRAQK